MSLLAASNIFWRNTCCCWKC